jgi:2-dehydro-3-deoxyglucarate aldolase/4-hydroxy-2-oxoheptanedioate aldolase
MTDLRTRILAGETLIGSFSDLASPLAVELLGRAGMDWVILDLEHGAATESELLALLYAAGSTPIAPLVRAQSAERLRIGRALDLGAAGIMLPQLQSIEEVRQAVGYLRYPPVGQRGVALRTRGADLGKLSHADLARVVNDRIVGIVQIEAAQMVRDADEIAALEPVDVLFVGPADLSHALGIPGRFDDPTYLDAITAVVAACERHGKAAGILLYDAAVLPAHLELGFRFIGLGSEGSYVSAGAAAMLAAVPGR